MTSYIVDFRLLCVWQLGKHNNVTSEIFDHGDANRVINWIAFKAN